MKVHMKKLCIFAFCGVICLLFFSKVSFAKIQGDFKTFDTADEVEPTKVWNIKFNSDIDRNTISDDNVVVFDENDTPINVQVVPDEENTKSIKVIPTKFYESGKTYCLMITKNIVSSEGKTLSKPVVKYFKIKDYSNLKIGNATVELASFPVIKTITINDINVEGATKFKIEESDTVHAIDDTITAFIFADQTMVYFYSNDGKLIGKGILDVSESKNNFEFNIY